MREIRTTTYMIFMLCCVSLAVIGCNQEADSLLTSQVDNTNNTLAPNTLVPPTISPTATIAPPKEACKNDAMFVTDLTIPDLSKLEPNKPISKLWQI